MSLRSLPSKSEPPRKSAKAILWAPIAVSPPRVESRSPPPLLEAKDNFVLDARTATVREAQEVPHLLYVTPTWLHSKDQEALIFFDQEDTGTPTLLREFPRRIFMTSFVHLSAERASSLEWRPLVDEESGIHGFCFLLANADGPVVRFEAEMEGDDLEVLRVVHDSYSPLKLEAGMVAASSFLEFRPNSHLEALRKALSSIQSDKEFVYMPTSDFVATVAFHRLILRKSKGDDNGARKVWQTVKRFVSALSDLTVECTDAYNVAEFGRAKCSELALDVVRWS